MLTTYTFETVKFKKNYINLEGYITYSLQVTNMMKYGKISEKLRDKCQFEAFELLQKSYFGY